MGVFGHPDLTPAQKLILLALETYADYPEGTNARPGVVRLAETCGLGVRVVEGALTRGRQLELIDQTGRANPKRGLAACYRLVSTRTSVQVESSSTRTDLQVESEFQPARIAFQPARSEVSTRTLVQPTNPLTPIQNTEEGAHARPTPSTSGPDQSSDLALTSSRQSLNGNGNDLPTPPPIYCTLHPQGTATSCPPCGDARRNREAWDQNRARRRQNTLAAIHSEIAACPNCDQNGLTEPDNGPVQRCRRHRQLADLQAAEGAP
jgi:hypothetical protein